MNLGMPCVLRESDYGLARNQPMMSFKPFGNTERYSRWIAFKERNLNSKRNLNPQDMEVGYVTFSRIGPDGEPFWRVLKRLIPGPCYAPEGFSYQRGDIFCEEMLFERVNVGGWSAWKRIR